MADVFISYSRRQSEFVARLQHDLTERGKDVWVDVDGIRDGEVFPDALRRAIELSDAFVFVITPESVHSRFCEQEVAHAAELNKRIVPLALHDVPEEEIPDEIRVRNWIPITPDGQYGSGIDRLLASIDTDLEWQHQHTRVTTAALEWDAADRDHSYLLRGSELVAAERWLAAGADMDPGPTLLQQEYLLAARSASSRRQRTLVGASLAVAVVAIGLLVFALISRSHAISARGAATTEAQTARSRALAAEAETQSGVDPELSILLASAAVRIAPTPAAMFALRAALDASPILYRLPDAGLQTCPPDGPIVLPVPPGIAFNPDGRQIAESLCDGSVVLADAADGRVTHRIHVGSPAGPVAFNSSGSLLAVTGGDRIVVLDATNGGVRLLGPRVRQFSPVAFAPTGSVLAAAGRRGILLWNFRSGRVRTLSLPTSNLPWASASSVTNATVLAFSPDGRRLAISLRSATPRQPRLLVLNAVTGRVLARELAPYSNRPAVPASYLAFSPDGGELAVAESDPNTGSGSIVVRDPGTLALERTLIRLPAEDPATAVAFSPDGSRIAFGASNGIAGVILAATGQPVVSFLGNQGSVTQVAFSRGGQLAATASSDGTLRVWRATSQQTRSANVGGTVLEIRAVQSGYVTLSAQGTPQPIAGMQAPLLGGGPLMVEIHADSGRLVAPPLAVSETATVDAAFVSPDGRLAGVIPLPQDARRQPHLQVWNIADRRMIRDVPLRGLSAHEGLGPQTGAFSPDDRMIVVSSVSSEQQGTLALVDATSGQIRTINTHCGEWYDQEFSQTGDMLAAAGSCGKVYVWDTTSGAPVGRPISIAGEPSALTLAPDGKRIALSFAGNAITVADVHSGAPRGVLSDDSRGVLDVTYSRDGRFLASADVDHTIGIWDARSLNLLRVIHQTGPVYKVAFTPDGRSVLAVGNTMVREWDACTGCEDPRALLALAETHVTRQLTPQELHTFVDGGGGLAAGSVGVPWTTVGSRAAGGPRPAATRRARTTRRVALSRLESVASALAGLTGPKVAGRTFAQWETARMMWAENYVYANAAPRGRCSSRGQHGPVWFLAQSARLNEPGAYTCVIPRGKELLVTGDYYIAANVGPPPYYPDNELVAQAAHGLGAAHTSAPALAVDGSPVTTLRVVTTGPFTANLASPNVFGITDHLSGRAAAAARIWILRPLTPGRHRLVISQRSAGQPVQRTTITLTVR